MTAAAACRAIWAGAADRARMATVHSVLLAIGSEDPGQPPLQRLRLLRMSEELRAAARFELETAELARADRFHLSPPAENDDTH